MLATLLTEPPNRQFQKGFFYPKIENSEQINTGFLFPKKKGGGFKFIVPEQRLEFKSRIELGLGS